MPSSPLNPSLSQFDEVFSALANSTRIQMMVLFSSKADYPCTILERVLPISKSTISYHAKILRQAQLIRIRREGKYFHYSINREVLDYYLPGFISRLQEMSAIVR